MNKEKYIYLYFSNIYNIANLFIKMHYILNLSIIFIYEKIFNK